MKLSLFKFTLSRWMLIIHKLFKRSFVVDRSHVFTLFHLLNDLLLWKLLEAEIKYVKCLKNCSINDQTNFITLDTRIQPNFFQSNTDNKINTRFLNSSTIFSIRYFSLISLIFDFKSYMAHFLIFFEWRSSLVEYAYYLHLKIVRKELIYVNLRKE